MSLLFLSAEIVFYLLELGVRIFLGKEMKTIQTSDDRTYSRKLCHVDPLLGNDHEISNYTTAVAK
jgi:hypothetical protein